MLSTLAPSAVIPPSAKTNACNVDHHSHRQAGQPGAEQDRCERGAQKMTAGPARNWEVQHLRREDESADDAEQGHPPFVDCVPGGSSP